MKQIVFLFGFWFVLFLFSCSGEEEGCNEKKLAINEMYIEPLKNPYLTDNQRMDLEEERDRKLEEACK